MPTWPESGVKLVIEVDDSQIQDALDSVAALSDASAEISINADSSELDSMQAAIDEIEAAGGTVDFGVETDDNTKGILDSVNTLKNLKIVDTIWNIAGTAVDLFGKVGDFAVTPMLDLGDAVAKVNAQTAGAIPNAEKLIKDIFYDDLGDSIEQVGNLVIAAQQLGVPVEAATRAALEFTHTFKDQDPQTVLRALDQLVKNGLAPDFESAGNLVFTAFQNGANSGGDLLTVIQNNAGAIKDLGLTGPQSMELFTAGIKAGFPDAQTLLNTLIKIKQNVTSAAGNATSDVSKTLNILGIANPAETGAAWSLDFFTSVIEGIKSAPVSDTDKMAMFSSITGGKVGSKEFSNLMRLTPEDWANVFSNISPDTMTNAAQTVDDSLRGALDDFWLAAQEAAVNFLSSDSIDLPGKIAALKTGLQEGLNVLAEGGTLGDALTIALKPVGLDQTFHALELAMLDFISGLLRAVATIQDITNPEGAAATRESMRGVNEQALAIRLTDNSVADISKTVGDAIKGGLDPDDFANALKSAVGTLVNEGDLAKAQALLDASQTLQFQLAPGQDATAANTAIEDAQTASQALIDAGTKTAESQQAVADKTTAMQDPLQHVGEKMDTVAVNADSADKKVHSLSSSLDDVSTIAPAATDAFIALQNAASPTVGTLDSLSASIINLTNAAITANAAAGDAAHGTNTTQTGLPAAHGHGHAGGTDSASGSFMVGENGPEIVTSNRSLAVLNDKTTSAIMMALSGYIPGAGGGSRVGNKNVIVNQNNYVPNAAVADALGFKTAQLVRGV